MTIKDILAQAKSNLTKLVTADNTDAVSEVSKTLDTLEEEATKLETENTSLKDKIVEMVKTSINPTKPQEVNEPEVTKTLDEIMIEEANKIVAQGGK